MSVQPQGVATVLRWRTAGKLVSVLAVLACEIAAMPAFAARPFLTDDARVVDARACQLETWSQLNAHGDEFWFLPACNFVGNIETTVGFAILPSDDNPTPHDAALALQAKTILGRIEEYRVAIGLAAGTILDPNAGQGDEELRSAYSYVPVTGDFTGEQRYLMHANLGVRYDDQSDDGPVSAIFGIGLELGILPRLFALGEFYGDHREPPITQGGVRLWIVPERLQVDAVGGVRVGDPNEHWFSVGLRALSPPLWGQ